MRNTARTLANAAFAAALILSPFATASANEGVPCTGPTEASKLGRALSRTAERLHAHQPITIVALGSSSTAGAGASAPAASYPAQLEANLHQRFPNEKITVLNRGVNGEVGTDMLARFEKDVMAEKPDLVLWQVGANSVLRDQPLAQSDETMRTGIKLLKDAGIDVVLIDPQFSPKMIEKKEAEGMINLIAVTAKDTNVGLFQRFSLMRFWRRDRDLPFETFVTADGIHMNDWGYACWAKLLSTAIIDAATRPASAPMVSAVSLQAKPASLAPSANAMPAR